MDSEPVQELLDGLRDQSRDAFVPNPSLFPEVVELFSSLPEVVDEWHRQRLRPEVACDDILALADQQRARARTVQQLLGTAWFREPLVGGDDEPFAAGPKFAGIGQRCQAGTVRTASIRRGTAA